MTIRLSQAPIIDRHVDLTSLSRRNTTLFKTKDKFLSDSANILAEFLSAFTTTSKRLADRKIEKFDKNITKRGFVPETTTKKGKDYPVGPILLGFFVFVVIGSSLFQIIRTATSGGMA
ncbi:hypothetical protein HID58_056003 [Brassica napus]|uniref:Stress-associated endoplasmic reticulum protein n=1 Tax=Brassica napus TaxID=3708 RepID=A0ABQ8AM03_BRANA|nr:hypothetical protein HID58_056003 [Brassica napus]